jgi:hypothetical protein
MGGRRAGVPNKTTGEARAKARGLLDDPAYWKSLKRRLIRGEAPRIELLIWEWRYGRPRAELDDAPGIDPTADVVQLLEQLGEDPNRQPVPPVVDRHDGKEDPVSPTSASPETNETKN